MPTRRSPVQFYLCALLATALALAGCSGGTGPMNPDVSDSALDVMADRADATSDTGLADVSTDVQADTVTSLDATADASDARPPACPCFLGDGPYCGARARALATARGCVLDTLTGHAGDLLSCESGVWRVAEACSGTCNYTAASTELDDHCVLPVCDCFVREAYCGSGAAVVADMMGCRIPLLPAHNNDILHCPGGVWTVLQDCPHACHSAPAGVADYCETRRWLELRELRQYPRGPSRRWNDRSVHALAPRHRGGRNARRAGHPDR